MTFLALRGELPPSRRQAEPGGTTPPESTSRGSAFRSVRRLIEEREPDERCELCGAPIPSDHPHLMEVESRSLRCGCRACAILFSSQAGARFRLVPTSVRYLSGFRMSDEDWEALLVPVNLAFFHSSTPAGRVVALYPSPAGATECTLTLQAWQDLEAANPILSRMEPDVEALLVNRVGSARDHFMVPIDECFKLVGIIRARWRGLSGGTEVWDSIGEFFETLRSRAEVVEGA